MSNEGGIQKCCRKCGETNSVEMFAGNGREKDGLHHTCKVCIGAAYEARRQKKRASDIDKTSSLSTKAFAKALARVVAARELIISEIKICSQCAETKPVEMFSRNMRQKDGSNHRCKACVRMNHEVRRDKRVFYTSNPESSRSTMKAQAEEHRQAKRAYRERTQEILQSQAQARREAKRIFATGKQTPYQRREAWIRANGGSHTKAEIRALCQAQNHQCAYCGRTVKLTIDHIIPVSRGGSDYISNICMACWRCNHQKRDRTPAQWIKRWYLSEPYTSDAP